MCLLNGELIIFGGSDETPNMNTTHPTSREVDGYVYHVRPRLRHIPLRDVHQDSTPAKAAAAMPGGGRGDNLLKHWHERAMAIEVNNIAGLVLAAEEKRARAAQQEAADAAGVPALCLSVSSRSLSAQPQSPLGVGDAAAATRASTQEEMAGAGPSLTPGQGRRSAASDLHVGAHSREAQLSGVEARGPPRAKGVFSMGMAWGQGPNSPPQRQQGAAARSQAGRLAGVWDSVPTSREALGPRAARNAPSKHGVRAYGVKVSLHGVVV